MSPADPTADAVVGRRLVPRRASAGSGPALLLALLAACASTAGGPPAAAPAIQVIADRAWELVRIQMMDGAVLVPDDPARYTLRLGADRRAEIRADCNRATASYALAGSALSLGPIASTRAHCPPPSISDRYLQQLGFAASFVVKDGRLHLATRADGAILEFR
ncbi:MAG TPA: META domain-containing protein [Anaeromyxobacteraceae bacterium]|nr:META domain-containing protein [Anaeromyxobacteraceae bacterium]